MYIEFSVPIIHTTKTMLKFLLYDIAFLEFKIKEKKMKKII